MDKICQICQIYSSDIYYVDITYLGRTANICKDCQPDFDNGLGELLISLKRKKDD
jgi:hypothetical protein